MMGRRKREKADCTAKTQWVEFARVVEFAKPLGLQVLLGKNCWQIYSLASGEQVAEFVLPNRLTIKGEDTRITENWKHALTLCKRAVKATNAAIPRRF